MTQNIWSLLAQLNLVKKSLEDHFLICKQKLKCSICLKYFDSENDVKDHIASHHKGDTTFDCQSCKNKYSSNSDLMDHMASKHQNLVQQL